MVNKLNSLLGILGFQIKKTSSLQIEKGYLENRINCISDLYAFRLQQYNLIINSSITGFVFSKNRAMQLHALITSYFFYAKNAAPLKILYTADHEYVSSYEELKQELKSLPVEFIKEENFMLQVKKMIKETLSDRIFFMTDDAVFLEEFDLSEVNTFNPLDYIFSLRLGYDVDYSFTHDKKQSIPEFVMETINHLSYCTWRWADMTTSPDWSYPLSVDGTIFSRSEIEIIFKYIIFKNPNSLEGNLQVLNSIFLPRKGVCFKKAKYVNVPCNIVQSDFQNLSTGHYSTKKLLELWLEGKRINYKKFYKIDASAAAVKTFDFESKSSIAI